MLPGDEQAQAELTALQADRQPLVLEMSKMQGLFLLQHLQLALRHPANRGATSAEVRRIALRIQHAVCATPALRAIAEAGWESGGGIGARG